MNKRRLFFAFLSVIVVSVVSVLPAAGSAATSPDVARANSAGVAGLPAPLQVSLSGSLGRDDSAYQLRRRAAVVTGANPAQSLRLTFDRRGAVVRSAGASISLRLHAVGTGDNLTAISLGQPRATRNRVEYSRAGVREWYVNGPVGLEQGFTLAARPSGSPFGRLTVAVRVAGARLQQAGRGALLRAGGEVLRYTPPFAVDAHGRSLPVRLEVRRGNLLLRIADAAAEYPLTVDPFVQKARLTASNGGEGMAIDVPVAISGDTVVAGGLHDLYVFEKPASGWQNATETARLSASAAPGLNAGAERLAIDGDTIVAAGQAVYVFVKPASGWRNATETARLTAPGLGFGGVAVSNDTVFAGAPSADVAGNNDQGAVYVFAKPSAGWADATATAKLTASDGVAGASLGSFVASDGDSVIANGTPAAYVFIKPAGGWRDATETARLRPSTGTGVGAVAISADTAVGLGGGVAYVFVKSAAGWVNASETATLRGSDLPTSGFSDWVGVSGDTVVAGGNASTAYVFVKPASGWADSTETAKLTSTRGRVQEVAISGDTIVGGTFIEAAVFVKPTSGWASASETARLSASDPLSFGASVAVSGDTVVVGSDRGVAYVFVKPAQGWQNATETARLTSGDARASNTPVAISGETIVVLGRRSADVFVEPPAGWASATATATLTTSEGVALSDVAIFGNTVVTTAPQALGGRGAVYVFVQPSSGWQDATESARLTAGGDGQLFSDVAVFANTVVAQGQSAAYLFERPATGWVSGTETARLVPSDSDFVFSVAISGDTVAAGGRQAAYLFERPASGWATGEETARLTAPSDAFFWEVAISGNTVVGDHITPGGTVGDGRVFTFEKPAGGWVDTATPDQKLGEDTGLFAVAIDADTIVTGAIGFRDLSLELHPGVATLYERPPTNQAPNCSSVAATPDSLKRTPDQMKLIVLSGATDADGGTLSYRIDAVTQDEAVSGVGDGTIPDATFTAAGATTNKVFVRAEANPKFNGRVYRIGYTVFDGHGGSCSGTAGKGATTTAKVSVPRKKDQTPIDDGDVASWDSFTGASSP